MIGRPTSFTLFPYTTLFRSGDRDAGARPGDGLQRLGRDARQPEVRALCADVLPDPPRRVDRRRDPGRADRRADRKSTRLNSSHVEISYAVFCLKKKNVVVID